MKCCKRSTPTSNNNKVIDITSYVSDMKSWVKRFMVNNGIKRL